MFRTHNFTEESLVHVLCSMKRITSQPITTRVNITIINKPGPLCLHTIEVNFIQNHYTLSAGLTFFGNSLF